jgi:hypothetical protein
MRLASIFCVLICLIGPATTPAAAQAYDMADIRRVLPISIGPVRILGARYSDEGAGWTRDVRRWRYGNWGGGGWTNGQSMSTAQWNGRATAPALDAMDGLFLQHDTDYKDANGNEDAEIRADQRLLAGVRRLGTRDRYEGIPMYVARPAGAPQYVIFTVRYMFRRFDVPIPFSEVARLQVVAAFEARIAWRMLQRGGRR